MTRTKIVHLLNDFALGGVTRGLAIFECPTLRAQASHSTLAIDPDRLRPPTLDADIIVMHFPPSWRRLVFLLGLRRRNRTARIIHVEHSYSRDWADLHVARPARFGVMLKLAFALVDDVVAVSGAQAAWLRTVSRTAAAKIRVIHPYNRDATLARVVDPVFDPGAPLVIGCYGRLHNAKGFDRLIDAFRCLDIADNMRLIVGGYGADLDLLKHHALGDNRISFVGKVTHPAAFIEQCHIIAVPSRYETYGQVANEAREAGRPILVSTVGGLPEQVGEAGLVVDCTDQDALVAALKGLRDQPLVAMSQAGRAATTHCLTERAGLWAALIEKHTPHQGGEGVQFEPSGTRNAIPMSSSAGQQR